MRNTAGQNAKCVDPLLAGQLFLHFLTLADVADKALDKALALSRHDTGG